MGMGNVRIAKQMPFLVVMGMNVSLPRRQIGLIKAEMKRALETHPSFAYNTNANRTMTVFKGAWI